MKNKYKSVLIYTGYAENSIQHVETYKASTIDEVVKQIEKEQLDLALEDDPEDGEEYFEEFFGHGQVKNGVGLVEAGEENIIIVLDESNVWYKRVDNFDDWSDEQFDEWIEFLSAGF